MEPPHVVSPRDVSWDPCSSRQLGSGGFGRVYLGYNRADGSRVAVKEIDVSGGDGQLRPYRLDMVNAEIAALERVEHPNVVRCIGHDVDAGGAKVRIFMEWVPGGDVKSVLAEMGALPEHITHRYMRQLLDGLAAVHGADLVHRDIKCANVMLTAEGVVKLADFGLVLNLRDAEAATAMGSPHWMAPEVIRGSAPSAASDMWSVGVTAIEMATGQVPHSDKTNVIAVQYAVATATEAPPAPGRDEGYSAAFAEWVHRCTARDPAARPSAVDARRVGWTAGDAPAPDNAAAMTASPAVAAAVGGAPMVSMAPTLDGIAHYVAIIDASRSLADCGLQTAQSEEGTVRGHVLFPISSGAAPPKPTGLSDTRAAGLRVISPSTQRETASEGRGLPATTAAATSWQAAIGGSAELPVASVASPSPRRMHIDGSAAAPRIREPSSPLWPSPQLSPGAPPMSPRACYHKPHTDRREGSHSVWSSRVSLGVAWLRGGRTPTAATTQPAAADTVTFSRIGTGDTF